MAIKAINQKVTEQYAIYEGDSCELMPAIPSDTVGYSLHSPPFEGLYKFSNSDRDVSNNDGESFWKHYGFIINELMRITKPGRLASVRAFQGAGWQFCSEVCIWKDPVVAQQRTKSIRLLHKQVTKDGTISGQGLADYIVTFRKPGLNDEPVNGLFEYYIGEGDAPEPIESRLGRQSEAEAKKWHSIEVWQRYASPVWTDISQSRTLQYRGGRDEKDEQHISPLQLDVIERCIHLWSNPGDVVFTPFLGIGSEVYAAVELGRRGLGIELKASYFRQAEKNIDVLMNEKQSKILF
jgi:DNA modification methylase